jgi:two-component system, response regulator PdtaR
MLVLIVEDQPIIAMMLAWQLEEDGYHVLRPVANAQDALVLAEKAAPDLALVDIHLQGSVDGVELARTLQGRFDVPCIFITAEPSSARASPDAALGVIAKPYSTMTLRRCLAAVTLLMQGYSLRNTEIPTGFELFRREY